MIDKKIAEWALSDDVGSSSKTMARIALGLPSRVHDYPYDAGDFGRCYRLIKRIPEIKNSFVKIAKLGPVWNAIIDNWEWLSKLYADNDIDGLRLLIKEIRERYECD